VLLLALLPLGMLLYNIASGVWVMRRIQFLQLHAGPGGLFTAEHPGKIEYATIYVPGMMSWCVPAAALFLLAIYLPLRGYRVRDVPWQWSLLLFTPTLLFMIWLYITDAWYFHMIPL